MLEWQRECDREDEDDWEDEDDRENEDDCEDEDCRRREGRPIGCEDDREERARPFSEGMTSSHKLY